VLATTTNKIASSNSSKKYKRKLVEQSENMTMDQFLVSNRISKEVEEADDEWDDASSAA
jgi:hypothetical protein